MSTVELSTTTFESTVTENEIVFAKFDTEAQREIASAAQITSISTLMAFTEAAEVSS
jgi:hypothetical protein